MKTASLIRKLASLFPQRLRDDFDYGGLMVGPYREETKRVFLCLDFDRTLFGRIEEFKPDLILTHHPFFFGNPKEILFHDEEKRESYAFLKARGIALSSYHTNFDRAKGGMNDALASRLGLSEVKPLLGDSMARGGVLPQRMGIEEFASYVLKRFDLPYLGLIKEGKGEVQKVALVGGGGWRSWKLAKEEGYDAYLSGDCPHHERREIILSHYNYLDIPHEVESIFIDRMTEILLDIDQDLIVSGFAHERPWEIVLPKDSK